MFFTMKDTMGRGKNAISQQAETQPTGQPQKKKKFPDLSFKSEAQTQTGIALSLDLFEHFPPE